MTGNPPNSHVQAMLGKIRSIGCLQELEGFCKAGREMRYVYSEAEQRALDEKRVELMRISKAGRK